jgi:hypothetical protein
VLQSFPDTDSSWTFEFRNDTTADVSIVTYVICVDLQ